MSFRSAGIGCLAALAASAALAGCGSLRYEESPAYRNAQQKLAEAKRDPAVRQYGDIFLRDAEDTLAKARAARGDRAQVDHLAYLAQRKVEIAQSIAGLQVASASLQALAEKSTGRDAMPSQMAGRTVSADRGPARGRVSPAAEAPSGRGAKSGSTLNRPEEKTAAAVDRSMGAALEDATARSDPRSAVFAISGIEVGNDRTSLSADAQRSLTPLVAYLRDNGNSRIIVEGYTNGQGSHENDLSQSLGVAEAVRTYLTGEGIDGERIFTLGRGRDGAAANAGTAEPARRSGRIEIGLFQGIGDAAPALTSRAGSPAPPAAPPAP
jgi:outer membrane protein OmpA-like peptidoglycan-associated protein